MPSAIKIETVEKQIARAEKALAAIEPRVARAQKAIDSADADRAELTARLDYLRLVLAGRKADAYEESLRDVDASAEPPTEDETAAPAA